MRIDPINDLAIKIQHEAQHAVRRRMLRPEIDRELPVVHIFDDRRLGAIGVLLVSHDYFWPPTFSSPGITACMPSQGLRKSKFRYS